MRNDRWNEHITLSRVDRLLAWSVPLFPRQVTPNGLTVLRMLLAPFVVYFLHRGDYAVSVPLFLFAALTDVFDGLLARVRHDITEWGIVFDPIADKLLVGAALFVIVYEHVNLLLGIALLAIEAMALIAGIRAHRGGIVVPANGWGKVKMIFEVLGITLLLIALWSGIDLFVSLSNGTLALALIAALLSVYWRIR